MIRHPSIAAWVGLLAVVTGCSTGGRVSFIEKNNAVYITIGDTPVATYRYGPELVKPVLYPVKTLSGIPVTRAYPFEEVEGESRDNLTVYMEGKEDYKRGVYARAGYRKLAQLDNQLKIDDRYCDLRAYPKMVTP